MNTGTNVLWYRQEAQSWNEALPLGNGRLGAMVYGGALHEKISLNEDTLWSGYPTYYTRPGAAESYRKARQLAKDGRYVEAEEELEQNFTNLWSQVYLALGDLDLSFKHEEEILGYSRSLDMAQAIHRVSYEAGGVHYEREAFISQPDQALILKITADRPGSLSFGISLDPALQAEIRVEEESLSFRGHAPRYDWQFHHGQDPRGKLVYGDTDAVRGMGFCCVVRVKTDGQVLESSGSLEVQGAGEAILYLDARTSFNGWNRHPVLEGRPYIEPCRENLAKVMQQD